MYFCSFYTSKHNTVFEGWEICDSDSFAKAKAAWAFVQTISILNLEKSGGASGPPGPPGSGGPGFLVVSQSQLYSSCNFSY